jgi:hypothetical protein
MPVKLSDNPPQRYRHTMRKSPYLVSLLFLVAATVLTVLNIYVSTMWSISIATTEDVETQSADQDGNRSPTSFMS